MNIKNEAMKKTLTWLLVLLLSANSSLLRAQTDGSGQPTAATAVPMHVKLWRDGKVVARYEVGTAVDSLSFTVFDSDSTKQSLGGGHYMVDGHEFVDLGLPSGLLWATTNVGTDDELEAGGYYAWGGTSTRTTYKRETYEFYDQKTPAVWLRYYLGDKRTILEPRDDAATVNWGPNCRIPQLEEFRELADTAYCSWTWVSLATSSTPEPHYGMLVKSKTNGNQIFLPAAGSYMDTTLTANGTYGLYWTATRYPSAYTTAFDCAYDFIFGSDIAQEESDYYRYYGNSVRAVSE